MWPNAARVQEANRRKEEANAHQAPLPTDQQKKVSDQEHLDASEINAQSTEHASADSDGQDVKDASIVAELAPTSASEASSEDRVTTQAEATPKDSEESEDAPRASEEVPRADRTAPVHPSSEQVPTPSAPVEPHQPKQPNDEPASAPKKPHQGHHAKRSPSHKKRQTIGYKKGIAISAVAVVAFAALIVLLVNIVPITVTVNGQQVQIAGTKTIEAAMEKAGIHVTPGNFLAIDGSVITEGGGNPFDATIGNEETSDPKRELADGETIEIANGSDIVEDFTVAMQEAPFAALVDGKGAIHSLNGAGQNGEQEVKTGTVSELQAVTITEDPVDVVCTYHNADVGGQKVVALTFDDGPNADYTPQILDILERNGASATFFTVGSRIAGDSVEIVQRAYNASHQICTHSWDHAAGSGNGVSLAYMTKEEQVDEILEGYEAIEAALGVEASRIIRTPGGNFPPEVIANLSPYITSEIGWNIDTHDWQKPGVAAIKEQILSAGPGDIILMHDGGGDRSQTVQALAEALPVLKKRGFQFVTIDQLLEIAAANG